METSIQHAHPPLHESLRRHVRERADRPAIVWYGASLSWAELDRASETFAARLQALGVSRGDPVVLSLGNSPQYVVAHYGIQKIGAIICPASSMFRQHELGYQVEDLQAGVIVAAAALLPVIDAVRADGMVEHLFVVHEADLLPEALVIDLPAELAAARGAPRELPAGCEDFLAVMRPGAWPTPVAVSLMPYTSGTPPACPRASC